MQQQQQQQQRAVQCSRLSCAAAVWFGRHLLAAAPHCRPPDRCGGEGGGEGDGGERRTRRKGDWVSGLVDDFRSGWWRGYQVVPRLSPTACSPPSSPPSHHPTPLPFSLWPLNPSHPLSLSPGYLNPPRFRSLAAFPGAAGADRAAKKAVSQLWMARVSSPDCCWW